MPLLGHLSALYTSAHEHGLLINILLKHKLPPLNIELENRKDYCDALGAYQTTGNIRPTLELMLKEHRGLKTNMRR